MCADLAQYFGAWAWFLKYSHSYACAGDQEASQEKMIINKP